MFSVNSFWLALLLMSLLLLINYPKAPLLYHLVLTDWSSSEVHNQTLSVTEVICTFIEKYCLVAGSLRVKVNNAWIFHDARAHNLQVVLVIYHGKPTWLQQLHVRMDLGLRVGVYVKSCLGFSLEVSLGVSFLGRPCSWWFPLLQLLRSVKLIDREAAVSVVQ